jgi:hypothetical protein
MVTNAFQTRESVGLNKPVYWHVIASASSGTMKHHWAASEREQQGREQPGHCARLRLGEMALSLRDYLPGSLERS